MKYTGLLALLFFVANFYDCESFSDIINKATELKSKAENETKLLLQHNRTEDAKVIEVLATRVNDLKITLLVTFGYPINELREELTFAEAVLTLALDRVNSTQFNYKELKAAVITNGTETVAKYNLLAVMLREQNITQEVMIIENDLKLINASLSTLKNTTLVVDVLVAVTNLTIFVTQIQNDFVLLSLVSFNMTRNYSDILLKAISLAHQVRDVSATIKRMWWFTDNEINEMTAGLKGYMDEIYAILAKLKLATNSTPVHELEANLTVVELRLVEILAVFTEINLYAETTVALLNQIKELSALVLLESQRLRALNKTVESDEFLRQNKLLTDLDYSVRNPSLNADIFYHIYFDYKFLVIKDSVDDLIKLYGIH